MTARITIEPTRFESRGQLYCVLYDGSTLIEAAREPLLEACRALVAEGVTGRVEMYRPGKTHPDMRADIACAARLTVKEGDDGPRFRPWMPFSSRPVEPRNATNEFLGLHHLKKSNASEAAFGH